MLTNKVVILVVLGINYLGASDHEVQLNACKDGDARSCYKVAKTLTTGKNAENQDKKELGFEYMRKACIYGEEQACDELGDNYYKDKHYMASKPYLVKACNRDVVTACESMGTMYRDGQDIRQDDVKSRKFYEKACNLKSKDACINVAIIYRGGFGVDRNSTIEKSYYKKACDYGSKAGCNSFTKLDNEEKGIETGFFATIKKFFK